MKPLRPLLVLLLPLFALACSSGDKSSPPPTGETKGPSTLEFEPPVLVKKDVPIKADVMFVLDATGSMGWAIRGIERGINGFVDESKKAKLDVHVGLTVYRDTDVRSVRDAAAGINADPYTFIWRNRKAYTDDADEFRAAISKIEADLGGDLPENSLEAMQRAADYPVRDGAIKVQVQITDASYVMPFRRAMDGETNRPQPDLASTKKYLLAKKVRQIHFIIGSDNPPPEDYIGLKAFYTPLWDPTKDPQTGTPMMGGMEFDLTRIVRDGGNFNEVLDRFKASIFVEAEAVLTKKKEK